METALCRTFPLLNIRLFQAPNTKNIHELEVWVRLYESWHLRKSRQTIRRRSLHFQFNPYLTWCGSLFPLSLSLGRFQLPMLVKDFVFFYFWHTGTKSYCHFVSGSKAFALVSDQIKSDEIWTCAHVKNLYIQLIIHCGFG